MNKTSTSHRSGQIRFCSNGCGVEVYNGCKWELIKDLPCIDNKDMIICELFTILKIIIEKYSDDGNILKYRDDKKFYNYYKRMLKLIKNLRVDDEDLEYEIIKIFFNIPDHMIKSLKGD